MSNESNQQHDPYKDVNHKKTILTHSQVKERNEAMKDYSKHLNKRVGGRRFGVYLGSHAQDRIGTIKRIWHYLGNYRIGLIIVAIAIMITSILAIFVPWLFAYAIDNYILTKDFIGAYRIGAYIVIVGLLNVIVRYFGRYLLTVISQQTVAKIRQDAFDNLQNLPVSYYDTNQPGTIVSRITNDVDLISNSLSQVVSQLIASFITLVGSLIMMFVVNWALALVAILFIPVMVIFTMKIGKRTKKEFTAQQKHLGNLNSIVEESITGLDNIKLYSLEDTVMDEFTETNSKLRLASFKAQLMAGLIMPTINFMNNLIYVMIVFVGGLIKLSGRIAITIGDISAVTQYARQFVQPISNLAQLFGTLQQGIAGAERVFELIDEDDEYVNDGELDVEHLKGHIIFDNVTFGYDETPVLKNVSFNALEGEVTAIVGPTGSGKTTIINLFNRFYDIDGGTITIDEKSIDILQKDAFRKRIGVVLQDTSLFSGSVYDNIVYGNHKASKDEVIEASKLANAHDFIMKLPKGYDTLVREGGKNFSQGERQLISIARTILSDPDILILDEATSNVDTRTEFKIQESMRNLMANRTSFVIAHRLQTIRDADQILVLKDGQLIESGDHHALLSQKGFYYDLYTTQFKDLVTE
ncbi:MAG: ABC transporter ATP-binding protein [Candidatus Izemoplasma sp.]|nr:ABC transporter ATP-binding protein [Candidatus Izemoplasma sp.]